MSRPAFDPEDSYSWAFTGSLNSRDHVAKIEPFQNLAICGVGIDGMTEIRPGTPNVCPNCAREAKRLGLDLAKVGLENDLSGKRV